MEFTKKIGRNSRVKHLRKRDGKWTKRMANNKSRLASKTLAKTLDDQASITGRVN